jgi:general secretion pathway protein M
MMDSLPLKLRRALALAILAAVLLGTYSFAIGPVVDGYANDRDSIERLETALARYQRAGREVADLKGRMDALRQRGPGQAGYLEGENETVAAAVLQDRFKAILQRHGGVLKSTQLLTGRDENSARRISVRGDMTATLGTLQHVLYDLEAGAPLLFIDNLEIRAVVRARGGPEAAQEPQLEVNFDVYGFMRKAT